MIYVAAIAIGALVVVALAFTQIIRALIRQHARERDLLINQVCALAGKPWQPAPARKWERDQPDPGPVLFSSPEQMTDDDLEPSMY